MYVNPFIAYNIGDKSPVSWHQLTADLKKYECMKYIVTVNTVFVR